MGIERALSRANTADLRVFLTDDPESFDLEVRDGDIVVSPKADITGKGVSGLTGQGVPDLLNSITQTLIKRSSSAGLATHERHRVAMIATLEVLDRVVPLVSSGPEHYDICAEELRSATRLIEALVGRIDVENLLDEIFSSFCLGK